MFALADSSAVLLNACCKMMLLNKTPVLSKADILLLIPLVNHCTMVSVIALRPWD